MNDLMVRFKMKVARRKDKLEEVRAKCEAKGATDVLVVVQDLGDLESVPSVVDRTIEHYGSRLMCHIV